MKGAVPARAVRPAAPTASERELTSSPEDLRAEWTALVGRASEPNSFAEPWFVAPALAHLRENMVRLVEVRDGGRLTGLMPLAIERSYGRLPVAHVQNWRHAQDFLGTPLIERGGEEAFWRALLLHLDAQSWAPNFLHLSGMVEGGSVLAGLQAAAASLGRSAAIVHRGRRAALASDLSPQAYYERVVRKKKRKELARLRNRLAEIGPLTARTCSGGDELGAWCDHFLRLERQGWKGGEGSALACRPETDAFFRAAVDGAAAAGRLEMRALELGGRPIAMLVSFLGPPGSFSFKTAFDEAYARFSPGVLLQLDNLALLERPDIAWMDSCAVEQHPMIDSLWAERRTIVRVTVPLRGLKRRLIHGIARTIENLSATRRRMPAPPAQGEEE